MMQRLTEYIGESVSMKKRIGIGRLQNHVPVKLITYKEYIMELYVPYSKLKGMDGLFVTMKAMCL